jgi:hypothetical protein
MRPRSVHDRRQDVTNHERKHLIRALQLYDGGPSHAGDYQLWVGFGDSWQGVRDRLVRRGYLRVFGSGAVELSTKGSGFFDQIRGMAA